VFGKNQTKTFCDEKYAFLQNATDFGPLSRYNCLQSGPDSVLKSTMTPHLIAEVFNHMNFR